MYRAFGDRAIAATQSPLTLMGGTTVVLAIRELIAATSGAPSTEAAVEAALRRFTAAGTGTSFTPLIASPGSHPASEATVLTNLTAEPTYTANSTLWAPVFNPRNRALWQAYDQRGEILTPLTANNGVGLQCVAAGGGAGNLRAEAGWCE
jgi:hypothetical protein